MRYSTNNHESSKSEQDLLLFCAHFWHFPFPACNREQREKILKINVHFLFSGVVGSKEYFSFFLWQIFKRGGIGDKRKISCKRAEKPPPFVSFMEKMSRSATNRLFAGGEYVSRKYHRRVGKFPSCGTKGIESTHTQRSPSRWR